MDYRDRIQKAKQLAAENAEKIRAATEKRNKEMVERKAKETIERTKLYLEKLVVDLESAAEKGCNVVRIENLSWMDVEYTNNNGNVQIRPYTLTDQLMDEIRKLGLKVTPQCDKHITSKDVRVWEAEKVIDVAFEVPINEINKLIQWIENKKSGVQYTETHRIYVQARDLVLNLNSIPQI